MTIHPRCNMVRIYDAFSTSVCGVISCSVYFRSLIEKKNKTNIMYLAKILSYSENKVTAKFINYMIPQSDIDSPRHKQGTKYSENTCNINK